MGEKSEQSAYPGPHHCRQWHGMRRGLLLSWGGRIRHRFGHGDVLSPAPSYGMVAGFGSVRPVAEGPVPRGDAHRALLGNNERMLAQRAREIGLVSKWCPRNKLIEAATWAAETIASFRRRQSKARCGGRGWPTTHLGGLPRSGPDGRPAGTTNTNIHQGQAAFTSGPLPKYRDAMRSAELIIRKAAIAIGSTWSLSDGTTGGSRLRVGTPASSFSAIGQRSLLTRPSAHGRARAG